MRSPTAAAAAAAAAVAVAAPAWPLRLANAFLRPEAVCVPFAGIEVGPAIPATPGGSEALSLASILGDE